ncbi:MAG: hypothetical protein QXI12_12280, partial [Candidatus Methanomethyliaceae archaeon]
MGLEGSGLEGLIGVLAAFAPEKGAERTAGEKARFIAFGLRVKIGLKRKMERAEGKKRVKLLSILALTMALLIAASLLLFFFPATSLSGKHPGDKGSESKVNGAS